MLLYIFKHDIISGKSAVQLLLNIFEGIHTFVDLIGKNTYFNFPGETGANSEIVLQVFNSQLITHNSTFGSLSSFLLSCFLPIKKMHYYNK